MKIAVGRDVFQLVEHQTGMLPMQVQFQSAERVFLLESTFSADSYHTALCAIACIFICGHVKDPAVHVIVW